MQLVLFLLFIQSALCYKPFFGFEELLKPAYENGRFASRNFKYIHPNGGETRLEYNVEHTEKYILRLDTSPWIERVVCHEETLEIYGQIDATVVAQLTDGALISGGPHWKCLDAHGHLSILRQVVGDVVFEQAHIKIPTQRASFLHFFKEASIDFYTNVYPEDQFREYRHDVTPTNKKMLMSNPGELTMLPKISEEEVKKEFTVPDARIKYWSWFADQVSKGWQQIKALAGQVTAIVKSATTTIQAIATGNYNYANSWQGKAWSWNLNSNGSINRTTIPIDEYLSCYYCYADSSYAITFKLGISNYALNNLTIILDGAAEYQLGLGAQAQAQFYHSAEAKIATVAMPYPIAIQIGVVPLVINVNVPIYVGYEVQLNTYAILQFVTKGTGTLKFGVEYTNSKWNWIGQSDYTQSGGLQSITVGVNAQAIAYVKPVVVFNVEYIGGPNVGLKPFFEFVGDYGSNDCTGYESFMVDTAWGFELSVGATIDISFPGGISIYKREFDPVSIVSFKKPLLSGCAFFYNSNLQLPPPIRNYTNTTYYKTPILAAGPNAKDNTYVYFANDGLVPGTSWTGTQTRISSAAACLQYPPYLKFSIQILDTYWGSSYVYITYFGSSDYGTLTPNYACTTETLYEAEVYGRDYVDLYVYQTVLDYSNCTTGTAPRQPNNFYGYANANWTTFTLYDYPNACTQLVLTTDCGTCYIP